MLVEMRPIGSIKPYHQNPRVNDDAVDAVAASIRAFGFRVPIVCDEEMVIIAGHTRLKAALKLGLKEVPVHIAVGLSPAQARAFRIADNQTATLSSWDGEKPPLELLGLQEMDFDLNLTGFSAEELAELMAPAPNEGQGDPDVIPEPPDAAITQPGDLWLLGRHRLLCGDSSKAEDVDRLLNGEPIHLVNTDPPYNVKVEPRSNNAVAAGLSSFGDTNTRKQTHHQGFDLARDKSKATPTTTKLRPKDRPLANDFVSEEEFDRLLMAWFGNMARVLLPGRGFYVWGGYANCANYPPALKANGLYFSQAIIWDKQHPVLTRKDYMGAHEWCFYGWMEGAAHQFYGPNNATDLWAVKKVNPQNMIHLCLHPDAAVQTESGFRPIRSIRAGDRVFSGDGRFHAVTHVSNHRYASEYLFRIAAKGGSATTDASDNHPFLVWRPSRQGDEVGWVRADELMEGDCTLTPSHAAEGPDPLREIAGRDGLARMEYEGREYTARRVQKVERIPYQGDVWNLSVEGHPSFQTSVGLSHNTEKPVELATRAIEYSSRPGENVLDLFGGSGSTLIAAEQTGRTAYLMELDTLYADVIVQRFETYSGQKAKRLN